MRRRSPNIRIKPDIFRWLRESSGWSLEDVSNHLNVSVEWVSKWERGEKDPTLNEIKSLSKAYKRPLAAFFLPVPERELPLPQDFRRLPGHPRPLSKKTVLAIRKARNLQVICNELMANVDLQVEPDVIRAQLSDDAEDIALGERNRFGVLIEDQNPWHNPYEAFRNWRDLIERKNIRVFQFPMELEELRGVALMDSKPYAIVINSSDTIQARIFTLFHEYGHILLHEPALCTPENPVTGDSHGAKVESWCNHFAGAFLLPQENIRRDFVRCGLHGYTRIAARYKVSLSTVLTRLVSLHLISQSQYLSEMRKLSGESSDKEDLAGGGGESSARRARRERGDVFVSLVLENTQKGLITNSRALDYLDIKTKHLLELTKQTP